MRIIRTISILVLCNIFAVGCAFSKHETPINYSFSGTAEKVSVATGVQIGEVEDGRAVNDPHIISHLTNGYGMTTSGGFMAEKPVTEIVRDGLQEALNQAGYTDSANGFDLDVTVDEYEYDAVAGFWSAKKITSKLIMSMKLSQDDKTVTRNTVIGKTILLPEDFKGKKDKELVVILLKSSMDDAISQMVELINAQVN